MNESKEILVELGRAGPLKVCISMIWKLLRNESSWSLPPFC